MWRDWEIWVPTSRMKEPRSTNLWLQKFMVVCARVQECNSKLVKPNGSPTVQIIVEYTMVTVWYSPNQSGRGISFSETISFM